MNCVVLNHNCSLKKLALDLLSYLGQGGGRSPSRILVGLMLAMFAYSTSAFAGDTTFYCYSHQSSVGSVEMVVIQHADSSVTAYTIVQSLDTFPSTLYFLGNITSDQSGCTMPNDGQKYYFLPFNPTDTCVIVACAAMGGGGGKYTCGGAGGTGGCKTGGTATTPKTCDGDGCTGKCEWQYSSTGPPILTLPGGGVIIPATSVTFNGNTY